MKVQDYLLELEEDVKSFRLNLHKIPEEGLKESKTSAYIRSILDQLNVEYEIVLETGIIASFKGNNPKKTYAFRTDIDGLSVTEESSCDTHSEHKGFMHACGHDGHMAMALGFAKYLSKNIEKINDNIIIIFQPAEEGPGGAELIVNLGILEKYKVDECFGIHLYPEVAEGKFGVKPGPMMAMTGEFDIDIYSKSAHGAMPHEGVDSIIVAADLINKYQSIISRSISPTEPSLITMGTISGGERRNIIAGHVKLEGTRRAFSKEVFNKMKEQMQRHNRGLEIAHNVKIEAWFRDMYPPVTNDEKLTSEVISAIGSDYVEIIDYQMISEDFSFYQEKVPGVFYFLGTYNEEKNHIFPLHNAKFNFDEKVLLNGIQSYINILLSKKGLTIE